MSETPGLLMTLLAFVLVIGPLVFVHEMGHYLAGRMFGVKADVFSVGFGREIAGITDRRGTRWKLAWLPLGGYVRFAGDMNPASQPSAEWLALPADERNRTFQAKPVWQRAIIVLAGPVVNLVLAAVVIGAFAWTSGEMRVRPVIGSVVAGSAAARAGLQPGDRVTRFGGEAIEDYGDIALIAAPNPAQRMTIEVDRGGRTLAMPITVGIEVERDRFGNETRTGRLGIVSTPAAVTTRPVSLVRAPIVGIEGVAKVISYQVEGIGQIISGRRSVDELGGPVKIARFSGEQLAQGWVAFIGFVAMLSINLGFINLLPVPMLDGGHLMFYAIEAVQRRPVRPEVMDWAFRGGLVALLTLMLFVTFNDLGSLGLWKGLAGLIG